MPETYGNTGVSMMGVLLEDLGIVSRILATQREMRVNSRQSAISTVNQLFHLGWQAWYCYYTTKFSVHRMPRLLGELGNFVVITNNVYCHAMGEH